MTGEQWIVEYEYRDRFKVPYWGVVTEEPKPRHEAEIIYARVLTITGGDGSRLRIVSAAEREPVLR